MLESFPAGGSAVVVGASGGIGAAFVAALRHSGRFAQVLGFSRRGTLALDITEEASVASAAASIAGTTPRLVIDATGFLHDAQFTPERSLRQLSPEHLARSFALNAIGPALLMKHCLPLLPKAGKAAFVTLSARVGSIGDNRLGGWYSYRAAKAALNQLVHTAAIELARQWPAAVCVALHPGTVATPLSAPFAKSGLAVRPAAEAVAEMLAVIDGLGPPQSGGFFDYNGAIIPW